MKYIMIRIGIAVGVVVVLLGGGILNMLLLDEKAHTVAADIAKALETYHAETSTYPTSMASFLKSKHLTTHIRYGVLSTKITISIEPDGFTVYYFQHPFGPFHGYQSQSKEWESFE